MMNGMSLVISKPCCRMYNFGTRTKIDLIPSRLSNLHLQGTTPTPCVATTPHVLKCRLYLLSALKDGKGGPTSQVPEDSSVVLPPSVLLGVFIVGIALAIGGILKSWAGYHVFPLVYATSAVGIFLSEILAGYSLIHSKIFSVGEIIQLGSVKGRVTKIGLIAYSLLGAENVPILVPKSFIPSEGLINTSRVKCCNMVSKIYVQVDEIEKINKISAEIQKMMKSNSNVYLKYRLPYCYLSDVKERYYAEVTLECRIKMMCEDELLLAKKDILLQSAQIIKKHGATLLTK